MSASTQIRLADFRSFAIEGDINLGRYMTRTQLEILVRDLMAQYAELPAPVRQSLDGAIQCAWQSAARGETHK